MYTNLINKKVYLFDLDGVISLMFHKNKEYSKYYHEKIKNFLISLKKKNKIIGLFTNNLDPSRVLKSINIEESFFNIIDCPIKIEYSEYISQKINLYYDNVTFYNDFVYIRKCKKERIQKYITDFNLNSTDIVFFDDHHSKILKVSELNIECIHVNSNIGIEIDNIFI